MNEPAVTIRKTPAHSKNGPWMWRCNNDNCGWVGLALRSQQAALREACRHLVDDFDRHHGMVELRPVWNEDRQRATATCNCGHEAEEPTEQGAEDSLDLHAQWLREELPTCVPGAVAPVVGAVG